MGDLHSPRWHRVSGLRPRLSRQLRVRRQRLRGDTWYLLADAAPGRSVRLNPAAYAIAARLDGTRTVQQAWDQSLRLASDAASQDEVIDLLAQLHEASLVQFDRAPQFDALVAHRDTLDRARARGNLLAWRIPLGNPTALLNRLTALQPVLFSRTSLLAWLAAVATLLVLALQNGPALWAHAQQWMPTPRFALLALLLYVPIKLVHETAHALAVRRWGGQVQLAGVTLMLLMPVPFVDASAANSFALRRHRIAVSAAGIMAELALAALALPLWLWLDDGLARDCAFVTLFVTGVSTLLFNANPLQRLDGYYIATDALSLPNLAPRSRAWWQRLLRRRLLGMADVEPMPVARGETPWLLAYAPLAWLMGLLIAALAALWIGTLSFALGALCAGVLAWQVVLRPAAGLLGQLRRAALAQHTSTRRWRRAAAAGGVLAALLLLLPLPQRTLVQGVVWPPDQAQLRADEAGFVEAVLARDGALVAAGAPVLQLSSPRLQADHERQSARVAALRAGLVAAQGARSAQSADARAGDAQAELVAARTELERLDARLAALQVRAQVAGRLTLPQSDDLAGQFIGRGNLLGHVVTAQPPTVRLAVPETEADDLRLASDAVGVRLSATPQVQHGARLLRDSFAAVMQLPSAALSARHGGPVQTDPADTQDLQPLQPVVVLDVQLDAAGGAATGRIGERAWVRFDAGFAPLAQQLAGVLRRLVLASFNAQI